MRAHPTVPAARATDPVAFVAAHERAWGSTPTRDLYQEVTDRIVAALEAGVAPWVPSHTTAPLALPRNGATGRPYAGVNVVLLWLAGRPYASPEWFTFQQARALGACVRKGERGTLVTFWREIVRRNAETGDEERIPLLRHFVVFNRAQIDGLPEPPSAEAPHSAWERIEAAEALVRRSGARVTEDAARPCYLPATDAVHMPARDAYPEREGFYADLLHELAHWTGHPARLARALCGAFGSTEYAREELVAELTSAFVCAALGIAGTLTHAEYLGAWLTILRADKRAIFAAAAAARRAADYLMAFPTGTADVTRTTTPDDHETTGGDADEEARTRTGVPAGAC
jgi:antirestriction protein ArdC